MGTNRYKLVAGRTLSRWLRASPDVPLVERVQLHWDSFWFELNLAQAKALMPTHPLRASPVLILGMWRSGTSLLHEWLSALPGCSAPRTWQCMSPSTFVVTGQPQTSVRIPRPMDALEVSSFSPQEDEFSLLAMGAASAYRGFLCPERMEEGIEALNPDYWRQNPGWLADWLWFLSAVEQQTGARLVLKAPNHTFRAPSIAQALPASQWIWVLRDPEAVWRSNWNMWQRMSEAYSGRLPDKATLTALLSEAFCQYLAVLQWVDVARPVAMAFLPYDELALGPESALSSIKRQGVELPAWTGGSAIRFAEETLPTEGARSPDSLAKVFEAIREMHQKLLR